MIEQALLYLLTNDSDTNAVIDGRIHASTSPQKTPRPKITYQLIYTDRHLSNDGPIGMNIARYRLDCWADTAKQSKQLATAARLALDGYRGTVSVGGETEITIDRIHISDERDFPAPNVPGAETPVQRVMLDAEITYPD